MGVFSHVVRTGAKFSRQMPVGPWFADFLCRELSLVVELRRLLATMARPSGMRGATHGWRSAASPCCGSVMPMCGRISKALVTAIPEGSGAAAAVEGKCPPLAPPASGRGTRSPSIPLPLAGGAEGGNGPRVRSSLKALPAYGKGARLTEPKAKLVAAGWA